MAWTRAGELISLDGRGGGPRACPVCGKPLRRTMRGPFGRTVTVPVLCDCQEERLREEERSRRRRLAESQAGGLEELGVAEPVPRGKTFASFSPDRRNARTAEMCRRYAAKFGEMEAKGQGLMLYGPPGTGKTHLACAAANAVREAGGRPAVLTSLPLLLPRLLDPAALRAAEWMFACWPLLVLDDLGAERGTEYAGERAYRLIDLRYRKRLPLIVTTNIGPEEMRAERDPYRQRCYDRLLELCLPLPLPGQSYRRKLAAARAKWLGEALGE